MHCVLLLIVIKKTQNESNQLQSSVNLYGGATTFTVLIKWRNESIV